MRAIMAFLLSVSESCDLTYNQLAAVNVASFRCRYTLDGAEFLPSPESADEFDMLIDASAKGKLARLSPTVKDYEDYFDGIFERGVKAIVHIENGVAPSGDYATAKKAAALVLLKFPRNEIYIVDSGSVSAGLQPLVECGIEARDGGLSAAEACVKLTELSGRVRTLCLRSGGGEGESNLGFKRGFIADGRGFRRIFGARGDNTAARRIAEMVASSPKVWAAGDPTLAVKMRQELARMGSGAMVLGSRTGAYTAAELGADSFVAAYLDD